MVGLRRSAHRAAWILLAAGVAALVYVGYVTLNARAYQAAAQQHLSALRASDVSLPAASPSAPLAPTDGDVIGEIDIPRLGLAVAVAQGDSPAILQRGIGHLTETALPGEAGNVVLAGHRDTFFRPLRRVRVGDAVTLKTPVGDFDYLVESTAVVSPDDLEVLAPTDARTLTLITCYPFTYIGSAPNRFIVRAREVGSGARSKTTK